jgi:two-component system, NtrC family, response regulator AtoC
MSENEATTTALSGPASARELWACWEDSAVCFGLTRSPLVIGRSDTSEIHVPHGSVSRAHARLTIGDTGMDVEDLGSANGTFVDGQRIKGRAQLTIGSILRVGTVRLIVRLKPSGAPSPMIEVRRLVEKVAVSPVSVILLGETGVGKEVLTEEIHARSGRSGPLVRINCAGLASTLLESELFGHERGAFTGAVQAKAGLIESAHGGTFLLDELGEMPESTQPKLLRVLESREVRRLGALTARPIDVRFISATHRDLRTMAALGKFREDLLFRLNGYTIVIPPLRDRRGEIAGLVSDFLSQACARTRRTVPILTEGARVLLESYRWPGNVRELRNVVDRIALLCDSDHVTVDHIDFDSAPAEAAARSRRPSLLDDLEAGGEHSEKDRIMKELQNAGGNQAAAAKALGITARMLGYRMDKLGLPRPRRK